MSGVKLQHRGPSIANFITGSVSIQQHHNQVRKITLFTAPCIKVAMTYKSRNLPLSPPLCLCCFYRTVTQNRFFGWRKTGYYCQRWVDFLSPFCLGAIYTEFWKRQKKCLLLHPKVGKKLDCLCLLFQNMKRQKNVQLV